MNFDNWKLYKIGEIFKRVPIKSISKILSDIPKGNINVVGNSSENNGVINYVDLSKYPEYLHPGNVLSYGAKGGKFFFQKNVWASTDHVHMFMNDSINENNQIFICTVLNKLIETKGGWSSSLESKIVEEKIYLPSNKEGLPDWEYMETFVNTLKERERERELRTFWILQPRKNNFWLL